jgi:hypothetical protein
MLTLNRLNTFEADRLHRKLSLMWRSCAMEGPMARRVYGMMGRVYLHLHKTMLVTR